MADQNEEQMRAFWQLEVRVDALSTRLDNFDHEVNGNGQPGMRQNIEKIAAYVKYQEGLETAYREARIKAKDTRKMVIATLTFCIGTMSGLVGWGLHHLWTVVEPPAAQIIEDYWAHHPQADYKQKRLTVPVGEVYSAHESSSQDAGSNQEARPWQQTQ